MRVRKEPTNTANKDKELIALARKAAAVSDIASPHFNPMTHNADALWLAVRLNLSIRFFASNNGDVEVYVNGDYDGAPEVREWFEGDGGTDATRRAITRAAARIGRVM